MNCKVKIDGNEYEGQYELNKSCLTVEVFNYHSEHVAPGSEVPAVRIGIEDLRNRKFYFSPVFFIDEYGFALTPYEKYKTDFFFESFSMDANTGFENIKRIDSICLFNPVLGRLLTNSSLQIQTTKDDWVNFKVNLHPEARTIEIHKNNIEQIAFNTTCNFSCSDEYRRVRIDTEFYARIVLEKPVDYGEILAYIKEFDVMIAAYSFVNVRSYEAYVVTDTGHKYKLYYKQQGEDKIYSKGMHLPIKKNFFEFIESMYPMINYRNTKRKNEFLLLDLHKPTSLEDRYTYYFRFIDLYMGCKLRESMGKEPSNYERLSVFIDDYIDYFKGHEDKDKLKNELNSLRNHFIHEGYYFPDNRFAVKEKRKILYYKTLDYKWLFDIVKSFRLCSYLILYKEILKLEVDENELKCALHC